MLNSGDADRLIEFFSAIEADSEVIEYFRPHDFDRATAEEICEPTRTGGDEYFAAFEGERIVGYGMLRGWSEGYVVPAFGVSVRPGQRGKGIGRALLEWAIDRARERGVGEIMLKVSDDNTAARHLYESKGFEFSGERMNGQLVGRLNLAD